MGARFCLPFQRPLPGTMSHFDNSLILKAEYFAFENLCVA